MDFFEENIKRNLELTKGAIMAERLMIKLTEKGMPRQDAHELVRKLAIEAREKGVHLKDVAKGKIKQLNEREINDIFNPATYIGDAESIVEEAVSD